jgi:hypothetical protein
MKNEYLKQPRERILQMNPLKDPAMYTVASIFQDKFEQQRWTYQKSGFFVVDDLDDASNTKSLLGDTYYSFLMAEIYKEFKVEDGPFWTDWNTTMAYGRLIQGEESLTPFKQSSANQDYNYKIVIFLYNANLDIEEGNEGVLQFKESENTPEEDVCELPDLPGQVTLFPAHFFYRSKVNKNENRCNLFRTTLQVGLAVRKEEYERLFLKDYGPKTKQRRGVSA